MPGKISERGFVITCWFIGMVFNVLSIVLYIFKLVDSMDILPIIVVANMFLFVAIFIGARGRYKEMKAKLKEIVEEKSHP